jgi:hypothetical protein
LDHPLVQPVIEKLDIQDPLFTRQWHLINEENPEHMMNVTGLWDMGITGAGVITALVDDGLESLDYESEDLADNFVSAIHIVHIIVIMRAVSPLPSRRDRRLRHMQ